MGPNICKPLNICPKTDILMDSLHLENGVEKNDQIVTDQINKIYNFDNKKSLNTGKCKNGKDLQKCESKVDSKPILNNAQNDQNSHKETTTINLLQGSLYNLISTKRNDSTPKHSNSLEIGMSNYIIENQGSFKDQYRKMEKIGKGHSGSVFKVQCIANNKIYAAKIIPLYNISANRSFLTDIEILKNLNHPNIIKLYEYFQDSENFYIISEFC